MRYACAVLVALVAALHFGTSPVVPPPANSPLTSVYLDAETRAIFEWCYAVSDALWPESSAEELEELAFICLQGMD